MLYIRSLGLRFLCKVGSYFSHILPLLFVYWGTALQVVSSEYLCLDQWSPAKRSYGSWPRSWSLLFMGKVRLLVVPCQYWPKMAIFRLRGKFCLCTYFTFFFYSTEYDAICGVLGKTTIQLSCIFQNMKLHWNKLSEIYTEVVTSWVPVEHKFLCFEKQLVIWKCK